jgi:hypothetical protein
MQETSAHLGLLKQCHCLRQHYERRVTAEIFLHEREAFPEEEAM